MADEPMEELSGKTPLEYARTPILDDLAGRSQIGLARTIPEGMQPGSDTANLSVLGYNPREYYTGRSPLEALSIGVDMKPEDIALRTNLITLSEDKEAYEDKIILDHSSDEISTEDAAILLEAVRRELEEDSYHFYVGTSYRHLLIWSGGKVAELTPPHDVLGKRAGDYLPGDKKLRAMQKKSYEILSRHPINQKRKAAGLHPANSCWFWGAGTRPSLSSFEETYHKRGAMISAVDLLKGIAVGTGMTNIQVEGANGGLHTNYEGKAQAAVNALLKDGFDFVYVHVEAPDEMGHQGSAKKKVQSIEYLDQRVIGIIWKALKESGEAYRLLVLPDHPTPVHVRTHTSDPIPYLLYDSEKELRRIGAYNEREARESGILVEHGYELIGRLFEG